MEEERHGPPSRRMAPLAQLVQAVALVSVIVLSISATRALIGCQVPKWRHQAVVLRGVVVAWEMENRTAAGTHSHSARAFSGVESE